MMDDMTRPERDSQIGDELRNWAKGGYYSRAAVELLIGGVGGRLAYWGAPWITRLGSDGQVSYAEINAPVLAREAAEGALAHGEAIVARMVANLIDDQTPVALSDLAVLDESNAQIALAALTIAAGLEPDKRTAPAGTELRAASVDAELGQLPTDMPLPATPTPDVVEPPAASL
jgi:hypothetical protein